MAREHGTRAKYVLEKCRCEPCTLANREYARGRDRATRRPDEVSRSPFISAAATRRHLLELSAAGVGYKTVARAANVPSSSLGGILAGKRKRVRRLTAERVLAITPAVAADGALVDATSTWQAIDRLRVAGWTKSAISAAIGQGGVALQLGRDRVTARNARRIAELAAEAFRSTETAEQYRARARASTDEFEELYQTLADILEERREPWRRMAACARPSITVDVFYTHVGETASEAREVCARCPVVDDCLAAGAREREGIWGGRSTKQRQRALAEATA